MTEKTAPVSDGYVRKRRTAPKKARRITPEYLHNAALYYLERYAASTGRVRRFLTDKINRSCRDHPDQNKADLLALIDPEIETLVRVHVLDDDRLAQMLMEGYRARGMSTRAIQMKLQIKGFDRALVASTLAAIDPEAQAESEYTAAVRYLQRRKLWPYLKMPEPDRAQQSKAKQKSWAALARQGYGPDVIARACTLNSDDLISATGWPAE